MKPVLVTIAACLATTSAIASGNPMMDDLKDFSRESIGRTPMADEMTVSGGWVTANRQTGALVATGNVSAVARPYRFWSDRIERTAAPDSTYTLGRQTRMTTCTNDTDHLHWQLTTKSPFSFISDGEFSYEEQRAVHVKNAWLLYNDIPVFWVPYWYYPLNTDYGWRFMPGYTSRWGGYFLSGYVYNIVNEGKPNSYSLGGSTYADYRTRNGFALGQTIRWGLKDLGSGKLRLYHAWDEDYDRYSRHWNDDRYNYRNWGSEIERQRYRIVLEHDADLTERDSFRFQASYLSDSQMLTDFFKRDERGESVPVNEMWYEHRELSWAAGATVSGPVNKFYGGTARLPEGWFAIEPQPILDLPVNYESQTRAGYLNREFAEYSAASDAMFRFNPYLGTDGRSADYQAFRADSSHRISVPFKMWDVLSVVPRAGYRGTWWNDAGDADSDYSSAAGNGIYRHICEAGATLSARASGWLVDDKWHHTFEPYLDYSFQKVSLTSGSGKRYYVFDSYDRSVDWLDQFGFEGRGLPYNWHGVRPGLRNTLQTKDDKGIMRTFLDADIYAAVPFEDASVQNEGILAGYPSNDEDGNYNHSGRHQVVPGTRIRWNPSRSVSFLTRAEYDCENREAAYADIHFRHRLTDSFAYTIGYIGRDHRIWDYLPSSYDRWNYEYSNILSMGFRHDLCEWLAWSPYIRYDCRRNDMDEVGAWFDLLTDCIGYRFQVAHETSFTRIDGSHYDADNRIGFFIFLRALGPNSMMDLARF